MKAWNKEEAFERYCAKMKDSVLKNCIKKIYKQSDYFHPPEVFVAIAEAEIAKRAGNRLKNKEMP